MKNLYINNLIYLTMINYKINRIESNTNDFSFLCGKSFKKNKNKEKDKFCLLSNKRFNNKGSGIHNDIMIL